MLAIVKREGLQRRGEHWPEDDERGSATRSAAQYETQGHPAVRQRAALGRRRDRPGRHARRAVARARGSDVPGGRGRNAVRHLQDVTQRMLKSVLIANRGEIACRVIRTARRLGLRTVAVYSDADARALHVRLADEAVCIGPAAARESYLNGARIARSVARERGCDVDSSRLRIPVRERRRSPAPARRPASSSSARRSRQSSAWARRAKRVGSWRRPACRCCPATTTKTSPTPRCSRPRSGCGFPLLIKPTAGGGGKGMRIVRAAAQFAEALASARREAAKAFGDDRVLLERFVEKGRHVEIQVFADCARQRRAPVRARLLAAAPSPEGHRGSAGTRAHRSDARGHGRRGRRRGACRRLSRRRHRRVPVRRRASSISSR